MALRKHEKESGREPAKLDARTTEVRRILKGALETRYYDRYHSLRAFCKPADFYTGSPPKKNASNVTKHDLRFSYVLDMQCLLYPTKTNGAIVKKFIFSMDIDVADIPAGWSDQSIRELTFQVVMSYMWKRIKVGRLFV